MYECYCGWLILLYLNLSLIHLKRFFIFSFVSFLYEFQSLTQFFHILIFTFHDFYHQNKLASQTSIYFNLCPHFSILKLHQMKLIDQKSLRKSSKSSISKSNTKTSTQPRQIQLRSRKLQFIDEQPFESCNNQDAQNQPATIILKDQTFNKPDQSPLKHESKPSISEQPLTTAKKQQSENMPCESNFQSEEDEQEDQQKNPQNANKRKKRFVKPPASKKIIHCEYYKDVTEIDFITYLGILAKKKMFSTLLINQFGQVIFADRLGSEHFEGSLNNFARNPIYSTILEEKLHDFFDKVAWIDPRKRNVLKLIIYSKNSKRRYSKKGNHQKLTNSVIFNRYLRCVSCEIKPIRITFSSTDQFEGYWNKSLMQENKPLNCFLLISRLSKDLPDLEKLDLAGDKKIQKFLRYTRKKQEERDGRGSLRNFLMQIDQESEKGMENQDHEINDFSDIFSHKEMENMMIEMTDFNKHSRTALTRGCVLNSGEGKFLGELDRA